MFENRIGANGVDESLIIEASKSTEGFDLLSKEAKTATVAFGIASLNLYRDPNDSNREGFGAALAKVAYIIGQGVAVEFTLNLLAEDRKRVLEDAYVTRTREGIVQS